MPEHIDQQTKPTNGNPEEDQQPNQQHHQHPRQPIEIQPDGTWILGRGADRWIPSENQIGDLRWVVERDLCRELGVPRKWALDKEKIEFHKRQLALLEMAQQAPRCEHVFSDGRCCKAPRVKKGKLCYAHTLMEEKRPQELNLPPLEDANAVMLWLMDVLSGLAQGRITEKTAGVMLYGLQLAMVNARFTTFRDTDHAEMVRTKPQRTRRNTKEEDFTAKDAKNDGQRGQATVMPTSEGRALPQRTQRNTEEEQAKDFTAENAEVAETKEKATPTFTAKDTKGAKNEEQRGFTAENAEIAEKEGQNNGKLLDGGLQLQNSEVNPGLPPHHAKTPRAGDPGVESAKSLFSGVEAGEGVADNRSVSPTQEPPRKSSQSEILIVTKEVERYLER